MFTFLDEIFRRTKSDNLGALPGSISLLDDCRAAYPDIEIFSGPAPRRNKNAVREGDYGFFR